MKGGMMGVAVAVATVLVILSLPLSSALLNLASETTIRGNTITVTYVASTPVSIDPSTPDYEADGGTMTLGTVEYDTVSVTNTYNPNGGISDGNGVVDVTLHLNDSRPFCIDVYNDTYNPTNITINISTDGSTRSVSSGATHTHQYIGETGKYYGINSLSSKNDWITSESGTVEITITDRYGNVPDTATLKIIFKPES